VPAAVVINVEGDGGGEGVVESIVESSVDSSPLSLHALKTNSEDD
jgi:hypothetical protein